MSKHLILLNIKKPSIKGAFLGVILVRVRGELRGRSSVGVILCHLASTPDNLNIWCRLPGVFGTKYTVLSLAYSEKQSLPSII